MRRYGIPPGDNALDRFLTGQGSMGFRGLGGEVEDTLVPPKLWEAKVVPQKTDLSEKGGWQNLMPVAASLPTALYSTTGAASLRKDDEKDKEKNKDKEAAAALDGDARISGSVNVSVLIAMPSPPKGDGEELPELMLGTAAVPIYTRTSRTPAAAAASSAAGTSYFHPSHANNAPATSHPTRAQLLSLYKAAQDAKEGRKERAAAVAQQQGEKRAAEETQQQLDEGNSTAAAASRDRPMAIGSEDVDVVRAASPTMTADTVTTAGEEATPAAAAAPAASAAHSSGPEAAPALVMPSADTSASRTGRTPLAA